MATTIETLTAEADEADRVFQVAKKAFEASSANLSAFSRAEAEALYAEMMAARAARKAAEDALFAAGGE